MKFEAIKKKQTYRQIGEAIGYSHSYVHACATRNGFSAEIIRKLKKSYPKIDVNDLLTYPK